MKNALLPLFLAVSALAHSTFAAPPPAQPLSIAAASDLLFVMDELAHAFQDGAGGSQVRVSLGSSGNFAAQIENGAPFDVFLAADSSYTDVLVKKGLAADAQSFEYGQGKLVLWVRDRAIARKPGLAGGLKILQDPKIKKIALANPAHAPYGKAAVAALKAEGIYDAIQAKLVFGENISQATQYVQTGAADAGLVALSLVQAPQATHEGKYWEVKADLYPALHQSGIIVKKTKLAAQARAFRQFLLSDPARKIFAKYGIGAPASVP